MFQTNGQCHNFNSIEQLKSRPAHLTAFLHHVISQFDPAPLVRPAPFTSCFMQLTDCWSLFFLIFRNLVSSAVLPLCWPLQADQLQRDQTGVHGPPHILHRPRSCKSFLFVGETMEKTTGLYISCYCLCFYILNKNGLDKKKNTWNGIHYQKCCIFTVTRELYNLQVRIGGYMCLR